MLTEDLEPAHSECSSKRLGLICGLFNFVRLSVQIFKLGQQVAGHRKPGVNSQVVVGVEQSRVVVYCSGWRPHDVSKTFTSPCYYSS